MLKPSKQDFDNNLTSMGDESKCLVVWKERRQGCLSSPCSFNLWAEHIMRNAGLDELHARIKIGRRNNNSFRQVDDTTLNSRKWKWKEKDLLMKVREESEKARWNLNIKKKTKIMTSSPITSWQIEGGYVEAVTDFLFLGSKITADGDCSREIRWLLLGRKVMTDLACWKAETLLCWQRSV